MLKDMSPDACYSGNSGCSASQALNREADLEKHLTEARNQAEAAEKKLALAEAKVRNSGPLRKLQMCHVSTLTLPPSCLCLSHVKLAFLNNQDLVDMYNNNNNNNMNAFQLMMS